MSATVQALLADAEQRLQASPTVRLDAELLLARIIGRNRAQLRAFPEFLVNADDVQRFAALLARRVAGEPVAYLLGQKGFWTLDLAVNEHTLIPRPDTEVLVDTVLNLPLPGAAAVLDLGTGSGAIALALAAERPAWAVTAVDRSEGALTMARTNAEANRLRLRFLHSDWFGALGADERFACIVSNPPYIAETDPHLSQGDVRFEPRTALVAGPDGLDDIRHIVSEAPNYLEAGAWLVFEHGYEQGAACRALLSARGFTAVATRQDLGGHERVTLGQWHG